MSSVPYVFRSIRSTLVPLIGVVVVDVVIGVLLTRMEFENRIKQENDDLVLIIFLLVSFRFVLLPQRQ